MVLWNLLQQHAHHGPCRDVSLAECNAIHNEVNIDEANPVLSEDADDESLSNSGSLYCPSASDDDRRRIF